LAIAENAHIAVINMKTCLIEEHSQGLNIVRIGYMLFKKHLLSNFGNVDFRDVRSALTMHRNNLKLHYMPWISGS